MPALAQNKKAKFDYEILETYEAGLVLTGAETKSVKSGGMSLKGAFVTFHGPDAWLTNAHISPYGPAGRQSEYDPTRSRKLLLHKRQVEYLRAKTGERGLTMVPLSVYTKNRLIKAEIAVARGRHSYDKREAIKNRDTQRELQRQKDL